MTDDPTNQPESVERHDPTYMSGGRHFWAHCTCGWSSDLRQHRTSALLDHGKHVIAVKEEGR